MRRNNGKQSGSDAPSEAEFNFGYFYRTLEEHVNAFATQEGCPFTLTDIAVRVGRLLQAKALRETLRDSELVPEVRTGAGRHAGGLDGSGPETLHVRPHGRRTLSAKARRAIGNAQRERWAKHHAAQGKPAKLEKGGWAGLTAKQRRREMRRRVGATKNPGKVLAAYWATMTPAERSKEMKRRISMRQGKNKAKPKAKHGSGSNMKGYWARMTPAERRSEVRRRKAVARGAAVASAAA